MKHNDELAWRDGIESAARPASGWVTPSRCVYRRESTIRRVLRMLGVA